jgi:pimeloyl-ACP methyl ester carboxylesterase
MLPRLVPLFAVCFFLPAALRSDVPGLQKPSFDSNGVKIHYVVEGKEDGEPVLLIHGFTVTQEMWKPVIKALAKDYKVIALDCRGHGGSEKPHDPEKYGLEMTKDAIRLLDHLKIDKAHVVGYSMGGGIALQLAARYPERLRTATLGGMGLPRPDGERFYAMLADSLEQGKGFRPLVIALTPKGQPAPTDEQIKEIDARLLANNDVKALAAVMRGAANSKDMKLTDEQIKGVKLPLLAVVGANDPLRAGVDELKKQLPDTKVVVIDKADHVTAFNRDEFVSAIKDFLDAHKSKK